MAVQAQHPSNVLFLYRNGQDGNTSPLPFNNGVNNPRKRGREASINDHSNLAGTAPTNPLLFSLRTQHSSSSSQLIDLSQLQNQQLQPNGGVSTGLRLASSEKNQQIQRQFNRHYQRNLDEQTDRSLFASVLSEDIAGQIKRQRDELERLIEGQGEHLRRTLAENTQKHYHALLRSAEELASLRLREKEAELERARRRKTELETGAAQLAVQSREWQARVRAQEAEAASLQAQLQRAVSERDSRRIGEVLKCADDAESCHVDPDRVAVASGGPGCGACRTRPATVVALPCCHVALCTECDRLARACPICCTLKNSSVEVLFS